MKTPVQDNPFKQPNRPLQAEFELEVGLADLVQTALEDVCLAQSSFEKVEDGPIRLLRLILDGNQREEFEQRLTILQRHYPIDAPTIAPLAMEDWVAKVQQHFKPIRAGRFYLYGSHIDAPVPLSSVPILMDAGAAFGTGEHETTKACLLMMDRLFNRARPRRVLDMGCGTAVLAIAAAKALTARVDAVDIDPVSVQVARANVARNQLSSIIRTDCGHGYDTPLVRGQYDLIIANILSRPLMNMAADLRAHLRPGGAAILSGLLVKQEQAVLFAHHQVGLRLAARIRLGPWSCLLLRG